MPEVTTNVLQIILANIDLEETKKLVEHIISTAFNQIFIVQIILLMTTRKYDVRSLLQIEETVRETNWGSSAKRPFT